MRFLVDECTGPGVAGWLREQGHEVFSVYGESPGIDDASILHKASSENWILITNDRDFGEKVFREGHPHRGVVFLRLIDERSAAKIKILEQLLNTYSSQLPENFVVVTESQVRFSKSPAP